MGQTTDKYVLLFKTTVLWDVMSFDTVETYVFWRMWFIHLQNGKSNNLEDEILDIPCYKNLTLKGILIIEPKT
jgi:hypothetical protein